MTAEAFTELRAQLILHEGIRLKPYKDTVGKWTIGVGRNLSDVGISKDEAMLLLDNDIAGAVGALNHRFPWFLTLDPMRQRVLIDMCFQLGIDGLSGFASMLEHARVGDYEDAATAMLMSKWAKQTPNRAQRLASMMRTGKIPSAAV